MMKTEPLYVTDLKDVFDPQARYVFLQGDHLTRALPLLGLKRDRLFVRVPTAFKGTEKVRGFFSACGGRGVVTFEAEPLYPLVPEDSVELYVSLDSLKLSNRRECVRYRFPAPVKIKFSYDSRPHVAELIDISEGGLRMQSPFRLTRHVIFYFELNLPGRIQPMKFGSDGVIIYSLPAADERPHYVSGIAFVVPPSADQAGQQRYAQSRANFLRYLEKEMPGWSRPE